MRKQSKIIVKFIVPLVLLVFIIGIFSKNAPAGVLLLLLYLGAACYLGRVRVFTILGSINYSKGDMAKATEWMKKAYDTGKAKPAVAVSYAYLLLKNGNITEPYEILSKLVNSSIDPADRMVAKSNYALVLWKKGQLDEAVEMLEEVCKDFKTTNTYGSLGYLLTLKGDLDRALQFNLEAYEYNSSNAIIADNLGQTYYLRGEYEKAREVYEKLIPSKPTFPEAYYNYGLLLLAMGDREKGLEEMKRALNYKFSFLSTVTREAIEEKIREVEAEIKKANG